MYIAAGSHLNARSNRVVVNSRMARMGSKIKRSGEMTSINSKFKNNTLCNLRDFRLYFEGLRNTLKIGDRSCWIVVRKKKREREIKFDCFKKLVDPSKNHNFLREILNLLL